MRMDLRDAVAVVTGASSDLGTALSHELARHGTRLALVARGAERLGALAEQIEAAGGTAVAIPADITDCEDRFEIIEQTRRHLGPIDILVNNARIGRVIDFVDEDPNRLLFVNLVGPLALTREVVREMIDRGRGHVLTIGSFSVIGLPYLVDHSASSAGLTAFSTSLAEELRGTGVSATVATTGFEVYGSSSHGAAAPWMLRAVEGPAAARKAIAAMRRGRAMVTITRVPAVPVRLAQTISERAVRSVMRALGVRAWLGAQARKRLDYDGKPRDPHRRPATGADGSPSHAFDDAGSNRQHVPP